VEYRERDVYAREIMDGKAVVAVDKTIKESSFAAADIQDRCRFELAESFKEEFLTLKT
jgi:hypothetical protein